MVPEKSASSGAPCRVAVAVRPPPPWGLFCSCGSAVSGVAVLIVGSPAALPPIFSESAVSFLWQAPNASSDVIARARTSLLFRSILSPPLTDRNSLRMSSGSFSASSASSAGQRLQGHARVRRIAGDDDLHRRGRRVLGQPDVHLPLPPAAVGQVDAADRVVPGLDGRPAGELPLLFAQGDHHDRIDLAVRPDLHAPRLRRRIAPDREDAGRDVEHALLLDLLALALRLATPGVGAPGADRLQSALVDLRAVAEGLAVAAGIGGEHQLR